MRVPCYVLRDDQRLVEMQPQKDGRGNGFVVADRFGSVVLACNKLPWAAGYISTLGCDRVSVASLYEAAKYGRLVHRRWSCQRTPLADVAPTFEQARRATPGAKAAVLGFRSQVAVE